METFLIQKCEYDELKKQQLAKHIRLALIGDMCRINALSSVKRAGSGHLGSSFSAMDIVVTLYNEIMSTVALGVDHDDRDVYFSSKGHDVPGFYAVLHSCGILPDEKMLKLRRLGGLEGHPVVATRGIEANSGSLGMGISKGKGIAFAKRFLGRKGRVFVLTGDGELQEGQVFEALQTASHQNINNLIVIVDHNKVQTDRLVSEVIDLGNLTDKFRQFGWHVDRCDGHNFEQLLKVFDRINEVNDRPKLIVCDTIKGCGVSFMEHPEALKRGEGYYRWHAGAPDDESFKAAHDELWNRITKICRDHNVPEPKAERISYQKVQGGVTNEYVANAYGKALVDVGSRRKDVVVLDADLSADCRLRDFEKTYPERFIENGIAEQDMVSMAGGLALQGLLPIVNSFSSFLASRSNEQIYTNASENRKVIYVCHYAGLIPAGPGLSHQSIRDISLFGALPNMEIMEPCNSEEVRMALEYCVDKSPQSCMMRLAISPSPRRIDLPGGYKFEKGKGCILRDGKDAVLFSYGPVMLHEALVASEILMERGVSLRIVNSPWLNRIDGTWLIEMVGAIPHVFSLDNHAPTGGFGDFLINALLENGLLAGRTFRKFAVEGYPACGTPTEVLRHHKLDGLSIADNIQEVIKNMKGG